jgi:hypothetical protein
MTKPCTTCKKEKPLDQFRKQAGKPLGLKYTCRECDDKRAKERYEKNKEKIKAAAVAYQRKKRLGQL